MRIFLMVVLVSIITACVAIPVGDEHEAMWKDPPEVKQKALAVPNPTPKPKWNPHTSAPRSTHETVDTCRHHRGR